MGSKRRSVRQAATRKRSIYAEPDTDDDFDYDDLEPDQDFTPTADPDSNPTAAPPPQKRRKTAPRTRHVTRSKSERRSRTNPSRKGVGTKRRWNSLVEPPKKAFAGPSDGKMPDWTSLPVEILRDIFRYASRPLHEQNVTWLMKTAGVCQAFAVPALEAYYLSPSILTQTWPHYLLELLRKPRETRFMDYNVKVKELKVDVRRLAHVAHNRGLIDLSTLVAALPQLHHLEILHPVDEPPFRPIKVAPWYYPPTLFPTLAEHGQRLKGFRWNRDMIRAHPDDLYAFLAQTHSSRPFEYLTTLTVCGFDYNDSAEPPPPTEGDNTTAAAPGLATSIALLPSLKDLTFISCDVLMDTFLLRLPRNLERLNLTNCLELTSDMLAAYLTTHGAHLKELVLKHNTSLNLDFLSVLKHAAPRLQVLQMDLRYYSERLNSNDADPLYDSLLDPNSIPTWPASLRHLELEHMQKLPAEAAVNLFRSLVDSAPELPHLRSLTLAAHINIPWRDRAGFRDQWIGRLTRVYQRVDEPPKRYMGSLRQFRLWKQAKAAGRGTPEPKEFDDAARREADKTRDDGGEERTAGVGKRMSHIAISPAKPHNGDTDVYSDSSPDNAAPRRLRRPQRRSARVASASARSATPATPGSPPSTADSESAHDDDDDADEAVASPDTGGPPPPPLFRQGLCTVVDIRIDNQRPRENQFTEGDFLDAEASGDEDWREGAEEEEEEEEEGYAW